MNREALGKKGEDRTALAVEQIRVGPFRVFSYLVIDPQTGEGLVVDPGAEAARILRIVERRNVSIRWIVCTHSHPDHTGAAAAVRKATGGLLVIHEEEVKGLTKWGNRLLSRLVGGQGAPPADRTVRDGDRLALGSLEARVLHTPGHSAGGVCLHIENHLFSGDTLFVGSVGRTDLPGSSAAALARSLRERILALPDATIVWPGHDYGERPSTTVGWEKETNLFVRAILAGA